MFASEENRDAAVGRRRVSGWLRTGLALLTAVVWAGSSGSARGDGPPAPGLRDLSWSSAMDMTPAESKLVEALKDPMVDAMNVQAALESWFAGRRADEGGKPEAAKAAWEKGLTQLNDLKPLPKGPVPPPPDGALKIMVRFRYPDTDGVNCYIVRWTVDNLKQYGVLLVPAVPKTHKPTPKFPLLLYLHGAAFGVPLYALPWLAGMVREGYVIIGPALRGEDLFATDADLGKLNFKSEGRIENLDGEVDDALSAVAGARKLPMVAPGKFAIIGHSFGAGVGLLTAERATAIACMVSYDAWLVNPFRYYWDRMRRGPNNWLSWEQYCNQPVADQLRGLMKRSATHHAELIHCPLLLFIGGGYAGSVFHQSHEDFIARLKKYHKEFEYDVVPEGGHNFVLYYDSEPAKYAYKKHMAFLKKHLPPVRPPQAPGPARPARIPKPNAAENE
ncbi:MAG: prolyl oligopeptidase family serine peptidase [Kiritimatiellaeota bacterium]|nr:prolyl oligopeptidase family serine peptidase [Kiritimatiellota bacterium]